MKKATKIIGILTACLLLLTSAGCSIAGVNIDTVSGSGVNDVKTVAIPKGAVTELEVKDLIMISGNPGKILLKIVPYGDRYIAVKTDTNILEQLTISADGGKLLVAGKRGTNYKSDGVVIEVTGVTFENADFTFSGNTQITAENCISGKTFDLTANGAIGGSIGLTVGSADFTLNGATKLNLTGSADSLSMTINGTGKTDSTALDAKSVTATINGAGSANVSASETLKAVINGAGSVGYKGSPEVTEKVNGIGSVNQLK